MVAQQNARPIRLFVQRLRIGYGIVIELLKNPTRVIKPVISDYEELVQDSVAEAVFRHPQAGVRKIPRYKFLGLLLQQNTVVDM